MPRVGAVVVRPKNIAEYVVFLVKGNDVRHVSPESIDTAELDR